MIVACILYSVVVPHSVVVQVNCRGTRALSDSLYGGGDPLCQVLHVSWFSCVYPAYYNTPQQHITWRYRLTWVAAVEERHTRRLYPRNIVRHEYQLMGALRAVSTRSR